MKEKIIKILITILFVLLPISDMLRATPIKDIELFNFSILELINVLLIGISFLLTLTKIDKKHLKYIIVYSALFIVYLIFHLYNASLFDLKLLPNANHFLFQEIYYIGRIYLLPILLIVVLYENKEVFTRQYYLNIVKYLVIFISGQIILLNLFRFSYSSYEISGMTLINKTSFIDVFRNNNYKEMFTSGLFYSTNQISLVLVLLLCLNIYNLFLAPNIKNLLLIVIQIFSMIILGTKTAALGGLILLIGTLIVYFIFNLIKKEKINFAYLSIHIIAIIITIVILIISPFTKYYQTKNNLNNLPSKELTEARNKLDNNGYSEQIKILQENAQLFKISTQFYEMYPLENDLDFWVDMAKNDRTLNNDYRVLKHNIMKRVMVLNNNSLDKYFGFGNTINTIDMERDYVYQYYLFGIIGVIVLIGIYISLYLYNAFQIFKKENFNYQFWLKLVGPLAVFVICYFSGHLFGWVSPMIVLAMNIGIGKCEE